jgi:hypothetical protein
LEQRLNLTLTWKSTEEDDCFADQLFLPVCIQFPHLAMKFSGMPASLLSPRAVDKSYILIYNRCVFNTSTTSCSTERW